LNAEERAHAVRLGERAYLAECKDKAIAAITSDPFRLLRLVKLRAVDYWFGTVLTHSASGSRAWFGSTSRTLISAFFAAELLTLAAGVVLRPGLGRDARWLLMMTVVFSLLYIGTHVMVRYRAPTEPLLAIVVAVTISDAVARLRRLPQGVSYP
jgi:hypothetical protein